ncbi:hypothetical protein COI_2726 [Mannheimia haemolytica serotype A2 str. OVINE]|nr:hypothetical protein COI_2726 [Mannheimia haemolytica serotype A2 str. OVINE]
MFCWVIYTAEHCFSPFGLKSFSLAILYPMAIILRTHAKSVS